MCSANLIHLRGKILNLEFRRQQAGVWWATNPPAGGEPYSFPFTTLNKNGH